LIKIEINKLLKNNQTTKLRMSQTIAEIYAKILPIVGQQYKCPITANKGRPGLFLEEILGIPHTSNCLDCLNGELKLFPVKKGKDKKTKKEILVPKESMAITMLSRDELKTNEFEASKCYKKMSRMLIVPYLRDGNNIQFMTPKILDKDNEDCKKIFTIIKSDYELIRTNFIENGKFSSSNGQLLQNRTKGSGHGSVSRAFYMRPDFMKHYIPLSL
jgi:DNA mismatch repair protein MutH